MKPFLKKLLFFSLFCLVLYPILIFIWFQFVNPKFGLSAYWPETHFSYLVKEIKQKKLSNFEYLIIGSSHAYCSFNPEVFEKKLNTKAYVLGTPTQTPYLSKQILKKYIPLFKPKYIIYELYVGPLISKGLEAYIDFAFNHTFDDKAEIFSFLGLHHDLIIINGLIYRNIADILGINFPVDLPKNFYNGYDPNNTSKLNFDKKNFNTQNWDFNKEIPQFEENIKFIKELGIIPILVYAPIPKKIYRSYTNHEEVDAYFRQVAQKFNIKYFNFNHLEEIKDNEHFFDYDGHLNYQGGLVFNAALIDSLKANGLVPN